MSEESLTTVLAAAAEQFRSNLERALPRTTPMLDRWLKRVPAAPNIVETCLAVRSFPAFSLPYWLTPLEARQDDVEFLRAVAYSTLNGYYFVRMLDNVADGDGPAELRQILPAAGYFSAQFSAPYQQYFDAGHPFWAAFHSAWNEQAESSSVDAFISDIDLSSYLSISSRKFSAAKGPLAAVGWRYRKQGELPVWFAFVDRIGAFSQLVNDLFDWRHDDQHNINTYLQSEFRRRRLEGEEIAKWIVREGFEWGAATLESWLGQLELDAATLGPEPAQWVAARKKLLGDELAQGREALRMLKTLLG